MARIPGASRRGNQHRGICQQE
ncbi:MAG: hypothetical protein QOH57_3078, partial [Mycobacterium sp.]|nr:hypothetical protein [Mycobacterium sp.]